MSAIIYSLWFKPAGATFDVLAEVIDQFAHEFGQTAFEPHVTLIGNLDGTEEEILRRAELLAKRLQPFQIELTEPAHGHQHFQCVFMRVRQTSSVMEAHARALKVFDQDEGGFMPHLSLVYGTFPDARRLEIISRLPDLRTSFEAAAVYLIEADSDDPKDWRELAAFPIEG